MLVSVGLPVYNPGDRLPGVVESVLAQDHADLQLVISDNASTDDTQERVRELAAADPRVKYHRQPTNVGILRNFETAVRLADGTFFRWISDDDRLEPDCVSAALAVFEDDPRLLLVTTQIAYRGPDGVDESTPYLGTALRSDDPIARLREWLRLLNQSHTLIDPLYGLVRRERAAAIPRRNMLREDEVFATKLALAGPWGHVNRVLGHRNWKVERFPVLARRLDVPAWQTHAVHTLQAREILRWLPHAGLDAAQLRAARAEVAKMYLRRQQITLTRRSRKLARIAVSAVTPGR